MRARLAIVVICASCFSKPDAPATDASGSAGSVRYVQSFAAKRQGTFMAHAAHANDLIVFALLCDLDTSPSPMTITAPNWSIAPVGGLYGYPHLWGQSLSAIAPDTAMVTFDAEPQSDCNFEVLADEFGNPATGQIGIDIDGHGMGSGAMSGSAQLTTTAAGDAIWAACFADGDCGEQAPFTRAATTDNGNLVEYRDASDPKGTQETASFTLTTTGLWTVGMVAIRPL